MIVLAPALALGFASRFFGNSLAMARGEWGMPWGARIPSWLFFGVAAFFLWSAGSLSSVAAYAAFVVLDGAAGFVRREGQQRKDKKPVNMRPVWIGSGITVYLVLVAVFYFLVGRYVTHGILVTWTLLAFGFALLLRLTIVGPKAPESWLYAPADHKKHERRELVVVDPQRARAEQILLSFRARGDATGFLELVREAARNADLDEADLAALEKRILASFARAGTRRDEDILRALDEVEKVLALRGARTIPIQKDVKAA